tara:strand:- start:87 stop:374 length:288 start_codon:yes stop_codon:yes gene_type:complete
MTNSKRDYTGKIAYWNGRLADAKTTDERMKCIKKLEYFESRQESIKPQPQIYVNNMLAGESILVATFTSKGDALICLDALRESHSQSHIVYTIKF